MKRLLDLLITVPALILFAPVMLVIGLLIWVSDGWPVVFRQERPGLGGKIFSIYKFRTMREVRGADGQLLPDRDRLLPLGRFLRSLSLDELPELWNILRGEMSFVGPRPLLVAYLPRYSKEQARRHDVLPGLTGWAQVNGRNVLSWEDKFKFDVWYVDHWSFWLDVRIILKSFLVVGRRSGINQPGQATMTEFMGSMETNKTPAEM